MSFHRPMLDFYRKASSCSSQELIQFYIFSTTTDMIGIFFLVILQKCVFKELKDEAFIRREVGKRKREALCMRIELKPPGEQVFAGIKNWLDKDLIHFLLIE